MKDTKQIEFWKSDFGKDYTDRNSFEYEEWNEFYLKTWGKSKEELNRPFFENLNKDIRILEVGCNTGMQLRCLQKIGFTNLYGIELQPYAVEKSKKYTTNINIIQGSGFDIPFKDNYFDLVFTNGVLIHISPSDLNAIMSEMCRCSKSLIWGFEYYNETIKAIDYRGNEDKLWKGDYAKIFAEDFNLSIVKQTFHPYVNSSNVDSMYLLKK